MFYPYVFPMLMQLTLSTVSRYMSPMFRYRGYRAWIGYTNLFASGKFEWVDQVNRNYTNWRPDEPGYGKNDNCTIMEADGKWDDISCVDNHMGVCKKHDQGTFINV